MRREKYAFWRSEGAMVDRFLCKLREISFWSADALRGKEIRSAYKDIKLVDELDSSAGFIKKYQQHQSSKLLEHSVHTTKHYSPFDKNTPLEDFPLMDKNQINENQEAFISTAYKRKGLFKMATSGSTGIPFICYQDSSKKNRVKAEIIYYSEKAGYRVGKRLIFLRALTAATRKSSLKKWMQNESLIDVVDLKDSLIESTLLDIQRAAKTPSMLLAYSSTFDIYKNYFSHHNMDHLKFENITGVVSNSEMLFDDTREFIQKLFHCKAYSRYSNQENGVIGQEAEIANAFIINEGSYIVEIFDLEKDEPLAQGLVGRIVVTDLYNRAMPMIRYDTGDVGSISQIYTQGRNKKAITDFGGRKSDIVFDCGGNPISPHLITNTMWGFPGIKQYQFIQETKNRYRIRINLEGSFQRREEFQGAMESLVGPGGKITYEWVEDIPITGSWKRRYIINKME